VQRRLFVLFLLLSFAPALVLLAVNWRMSQETLSYLDSPGLSAAMESSLELARDTLAREKSSTQHQADSLQAEFAAGREPGATTGLAWRRGAERSGDTELLLALAELSAPERGPRRLETAAGPAILAAAGELLLLRRMDPELSARLDAVAAGGGRQRQMGGFYRELLRGEVLITLVGLGLVLLLIALLLSRRLARQLASPLADLAEGTKRIAAGELDYRVRTHARDEVADLVAAFNRMGEDLEHGRDELLRAERVAAWQGIARRLAHEIKNPLTPINLAMHRIEGKCEDPAVSESIEAVLEETANLERLADEFSIFARLPEPEPEAAEFTDLLGAVLELYLDAKRYRCRREGWPEAAPLRVDPGQIRQLLANLVKNAAEAMGAEGELVLRLTGEAKHWRLEIEDSGPGIPGDPEALFTPYVSSKAAGTGLGLAIARKIAEDHGGGLEAANIEGGGARFTLRLPRPESEESA
jgi:two-component system, NtrC family, nitrogen regulation sensor histidine kinase NtrY